MNQTHQLSDLRTNMFWQSQPVVNLLLYSPPNETPNAGRSVDHICGFGARNATNPSLPKHVPALRCRSCEQARPGRSIDPSEFLQLIHTTVLQVQLD